LSWNSLEKKLVSGEEMKGLPLSHITPASKEQLLPNKKEGCRGFVCFK